METTKRVTKRSLKQQESEQALERLREMIKPGDTIYTILRHRAKSGMYRAIDLYLLNCVNGKPERHCISWTAAKSM